MEFLFQNRYPQIPILVTDGMFHRREFYTHTFKKKVTSFGLNYDKDMQIMFMEAGCLETARVYENRVLTTLNLTRSVDGEQQKLLISRIKANEVKLNAMKKPNALERAKAF